MNADERRSGTRQAIDLSDLRGTKDEFNGRLLKRFRLTILQMGLRRFADWLGVPASHVANVEQGRRYDQSPALSETDEGSEKDAQRCGRCGACCRLLLLDVSGCDLLREPRWAEYITPYRDVDYTDWQAEPDSVIWHVETKDGCPFLAADNRCTIYPTRPDMCVAFRAGLDDRCRKNPGCIMDYGESVSRTTDHEPRTANDNEQAVDRRPETGGTLPAASSLRPTA